MHEMSIAEGIVQVLEEQAKEQHYSKVEAVTRGTLAQDASLQIINIKGEAFCMQCLKNVPITQRYDSCQSCGSHQLQVTQGDEMRIKELEVE